MGNIEIKPSGKLLIPVVVILIIAVLSSIYFIFISDIYRKNSMVKLGHILLTVYVVYIIGVQIKIIFYREWVLKIGEDSISLKIDNCYGVIPKTKILEINIENREEDGYFLTVKTKEEKFNVNISWLEKSPKQINDILINYGYVSSVIFL